jgi:hypothetical protein
MTACSDRRNYLGVRYFESWFIGIHRSQKFKNHWSRPFLFHPLRTQFIIHNHLISWRYVRLMYAVDKVLLNKLLRSKQQKAMKRSIYISVVSVIPRAQWSIHSSPTLVKQENGKALTEVFLHCIITACLMRSESSVLCVADEWMLLVCQLLPIPENRF